MLICLGSSFRNDKRPVLYRPFFVLKNIINTNLLKSSMKKFLQKAALLCLVPVSLLASAGEGGRGDLSEEEMWGHLLAPIYTHLDLSGLSTEIRSHSEREFSFLWRAKVRDVNGAFPWLCAQAPAFLGALGELIGRTIGNEKPYLGEVMRTVRSHDMTQTDLDRAALLTGDSQYGFVLLSRLKDKEDPWLEACTSLLKDVETSSRMLGGILKKSCLPLGGDSYKVSQKLVTFFDEEHFTIERLQVLAGCHFLTAQLQAILTHETERGALYTNDVLGQLSQILELAFLRNASDWEGNGVVHFEHTKTILQSVDERGWERTLKVARTVNTFATFENLMLCFTDASFFDCLYNLHEKEQALFRRCLDAKMSIERSRRFVNGVRYRIEIVDELLIRPLLLLRYYDPVRDVYLVSENELNILKKMLQDMSELDAGNLQNAVGTNASLQMLEPVASLELPTRLRAPAVKARNWLCAKVHSSGASSSSSSVAVQVDPERLELFKALLEGVPDEHMCVLTCDLVQCQDLQRLRDLIEVNIPPQCRVNYLDAYCFERAFDKPFLRPLSILLGRHDTKNTLHKELTRKLSESSVDPRVFSQMVSLPLSQEGMLALIGWRINYSMEAWTPFKEALEEVIRHDPERDVDFIKNSPWPSDVDYLGKLAKHKNEYLQESSSVASSSQASSSS